MWVLTAPVFSKDTSEHYKEWVDSIISARLPDPTKTPKLFELPLPSSLKDHGKADIIVERNRILTKVKEYIDEKIRSSQS